MNAKHIVSLVGIAVLLLLAWKAAPFYLFFAYQDGSRLPATPWIAMPADAPSVQRLGNEVYRQTGDGLLPAMEEHRRKIGAAAISAAVLVGSDVVWAGSSGWADIGTGSAATPDTRFRIGSTSKALTATGLARLVEGGRIGFDTPLKALWDELPNPAWAQITPRQLGSHMSGLPHYGDNTDLGGLVRSMALQHHYASVQEAITVFDGSDLLFEPGSRFAYSSYGTVLLSAAMSRASGASYLDTMDELVFSANGMQGVVVSPKSADALPDLATPYHSNGETGDGLRLRRWRDVDLSHRLAGGGFAATSTDLVKLGRSYFGESNSGAIDPAVIEQLWTPQRLDNGEVNQQGYGIGWRIRHDEFLPGQRRLQVNHGGVTRGGQSWLMLIPKEELAIAVNINGRTEVFWDFGRFSFDIATAFLERKGELAR